MRIVIIIITFVIGVTRNYYPITSVGKTPFSKVLEEFIDLGFANVVKYTKYVYYFNIELLYH